MFIQDSNLKIIHLSIVYILFASLLPTQVVYPFFLSDSTDTVQHQDSVLQKGFTNFKKFEGYTIENLTITVLDLQGPNRYQKKDIFLVKDVGGIINNLHSKTEPWVVKNYLLFEKGDTVNSVELSESERLLRRSQMFQDVIIMVDTLLQKDKAVDVFVIVQDRWTQDYRGNYNSDRRYYSAGIKDENFLGYGHTMQSAITYDERQDAGFGVALGYNIPNLMGSFMAFDTKLVADSKNHSFSLGLERPYLSQEFGLVGGGNIYFGRDHFIFDFNEAQRIFIPFRFMHLDTWLGNSIASKDLVLFRTDKDFTILTSGRITYKTSHLESDSPYISGELFKDRTVALLKIGLLQRQYYKDTHVALFGHTEDIAVGKSISFTAGAEISTHLPRWYYGFQIDYSFKIDQMGYFSFLWNSGVFQKEDTFEEWALDIQALYHTPLYEMNDWKLRLFGQMNLLLGYDRIEGEQIFLDKRNHFHGDFTASGVKRGTINLEARFFTPWEILGFRTSINPAFDLGSIVSDDEFVFNANDLYRAYSLNLLAHNPQLSKKVFGISFVYNPRDNQGNKDIFSVMFKGSIVLDFYETTITKPQIVNYSDQAY